jgi:RNA polymerase sigma factor (TIGR02999 family)
MSREGTEKAKPAEVTELLNQWLRGDEKAGDRAAALVSAELHAIASHWMRLYRPGQTIRTTALVNEACMRLLQGAQRRRSRGKALEFRRRGKFFGFMRKTMGNLLKDYWRKKLAGVRAGIQVDLSEGQPVVQDQSTDVRRLRDALRDLERSDPRAATVARLTYFGGCTYEDVAAELLRAGYAEVSPSTVGRDLRFARAFLYEQLRNAPRVR